MAAQGPSTGLVSRSALRLAVGDLVVLVAVILVGELMHNVNPLTQPIQVVETTIPFLLGWVVLAAILGIYAATPTSGVASVRQVAGAWLGAANVGLVLRGAPMLHGDVTWPFPLVITGFVLIGLVCWRGIAAFAWSGVRQEVAQEG